MTVADDLEAARASLVMINPAPYNARHRRRRSSATSPPRSCTTCAATSRCRTTTAPWRSEAPSGADHPDPRRPARDAGTRPHRHARVRRQRATGHAAAADRRTLGRLRRLHGTLDRRAAARGAGPGRPVRTTASSSCPGRRPRALPPPGDPARDRPGQPHLHPGPSARPGDRPGVGDPHRLRDERPAPQARPRRALPADRAPLVRRRVREVAEPARRPHRALHRRVPDRPLHVRVAGPPPRAGHPDAGARPDHRPGARTIIGVAPTRSAGRRGPAPAPSPASTSASPEKATGCRRSSTRPAAATTGRTGASPGTPSRRPHTLRARATDAAGNVQPDVPPWNRLGYGNNAIEVIFVDRR